MLKLFKFNRNYNIFQKNRKKYCKMGRESSLYKEI